jgi:hypothetical protein
MAAKLSPCKVRVKQADPIVIPGGHLCKEPLQINGIRILLETSS